MPAEPKTGGSPTYVNPWARYLPWIAGFVLVAGAVAFSISYFAGSDSKASPAAPAQTGAADVPGARKSVPFDPAARQVAGRFLQTAVPRKNLRESWTITHPELRQGYTLKDWLSGTIPVQYYPTGGVELATFKIDESYADEATIEVALLPAKGQKIKPQIFFVGLKKYKGKWMVNYFAPRSTIPIPDAGQG
jgi:hypothetical protein